MVLRPGALRLRFLTGPQRGDTVVLRAPRVRIGRSRDNDLRLPDHEGAQSSGRHAELVVEHRRWWLCDLGSTNGTWVNGTRISRAPLRGRDRVRFGDVECVVQPNLWRTGLIGFAVVALALFALVPTAVAPHQTRVWDAVVPQLAPSVFAVVETSGGTRRLVGTAFVVDAGLLGTNAHVAAAIETAAGESRAYVIQHASGEARVVRAVHISPRWRRGSVAEDVALLAVEALPANALPLTMAVSGDLSSGGAVGTFGFPEASTDPRRPQGRLAVDTLREQRNGYYLSAGLSIAPGTSGSPIFTPEGTVVGLVVGGDFRAGPDGTMQPSGSNANWGLTVTPLQALLRSVRQPVR